MDVILGVVQLVEQVALQLPQVTPSFKCIIDESSPLEMWLTDPVLCG